MKDIDQVLLEAASNGNLEAVQRCLGSGADVNARSNVDWTVLHYAAKNGHESIVKTLVQAGADINLCEDKTQQSALHFAAHQGRSSVVKTLIQAGAKLDIPNYWDQHPLHLAAFNEELDSLIILIESGANINARDRKGRTALMHAVLWGNKEIVKHLIRLNAEWTSEDRRHCLDPEKSSETISFIDAEIAARELGKLDDDLLQPEKKERESVAQRWRL